MGAVVVRIFHSAWLHLYESLAVHWQQRGEGRDGDKEKEALTDNRQVDG